ncbi:hypothetical protein V8E51_007590 [Hyaloscypha variabilis]
MGYSEVVCHLCSVSFNIGRIRTKAEPRDAAWRSADWGASEGTFVMGDGFSYRGCGGETGCFVVLRTEEKMGERSGGGEGVGWEGEGGDWDDGEDGGEFVDEIEGGEEEVLEYEEDDGEEGSDVEMEDVEEEEVEEEKYCEDYLALLRNLRAMNDRPQTPKPDIFYPIDLEAGDTFESALWEREKTKYGAEDESRGVSLVGVEHVAGPRCFDDRGYNGHNIPAEEMKGCTTYQFLAYKSSDWHPESNDEEWEERSQVFLTGIGDRFPSRDMASPEVIPVRHGWNEGDSDSWNGGGNDRSVAMPFHPTCFDIFMRLSRRHLGKIDVHGLMEWRNSKFADAGRSFSCDPNVEKGREQWWAHHAGSEYLAANPLYIPGLRSIFEVARTVDSSFSPRNSAFSPLPATSSILREIGAVTEDPFLALPQELREHIVDHLDSQEIVALRLASRAFHELPISLWYKLLRREMPWLWEVYSDHKPSFWTALEVLDLKREAKAKEAWTEKMDLKRYFISCEMPEILGEWEKDQPRFAGIEAVGKAHRMAEGVGKMVEREGTNWYLLYKGIRMAKLKGLRNRERIWRDIGKIVEQIRILREEGKIAE